MLDTIENATRIVSDGLSMSDWSVYMVRCADDSLYTGSCVDVERRLAEHNGAGRGGARYTRSRRPVRLVYSEACQDRSEAARREAQIKALPKAAKEELIADSQATGVQ